ncbi:Fet4p NDAI_0B02450 [Naumovozyma dairenensis CBS 421]|uniref:Low-affinity Fe(2+) transport protein n=1 Tax=Naumovozyma dairenensis (strain ATCC 10597 / BCRC 20456 / CBS 421 / NBRC 0211 / NRRL Y-12639) TaxID=1071378 RepID=G0W669_NAUDC|nr:hypothetical protein NDAI_0B02450 [Naumovozyma dairenensis CBS 421]CCD23280.1 hypothetical protein NDAI_0B02450 [Naumovozyma dairenensis CBS 421]
MGRILAFFGNPGQRPTIHHRAPLPISHECGSDLDHVCTVEEGEEEEVITIIDENGEKKETLKQDLRAISSNSDQSTAVELSDMNIESDGSIITSHGFTGLNKGYTDKVLDILVDFAGGQIVFCCVWIILIIWIVIGIVYNGSYVWQVVMQDGQSIQCYIWDTLLMRQQLTSTHEQVLVCCQLRSRMSTFKDFLTRTLNVHNHDKDDTNNNIPLSCSASSITSNNCNESNDKTTQDKSKINEDNEYCQEKNAETPENSLPESSDAIINPEMDMKTIAGELPIENWYDRFSSISSNIIGSVPCMILFWLGIIVWIICGVIPKDAGNSPPYTGRTTGSNPKLKKFSDAWQMYINTAVAVSLLICTTFLQNIRARHDKFIAKFLVNTFEIDDKIDIRLRTYFKDFRLANPVITVPPGKRTWGEKCIDWYADIIGTGIGVMLAIAFFGVWIGIGSPLHWDDNWWLIIGTYTGLVGFLDGYVIRQVYFRIIEHEEENYSKVAEQDLELFQVLGIDCPEEFTGKPQGNVTKTLNYKISSFVNRICSDQLSVLASILIIIGLICVSSGLRWSTTGQLIANTPTMIIEEFFLIVLLQAHNWADQQRRVEVSALLARRQILLAYVENHFPVIKY